MTEPTTPGSADGGPQGTAPGLIDRDQLRTMSADEIVAAKEAGRLDHLLGINPQENPR